MNVPIPGAGGADAIAYYRAATLDAGKLIAHARIIRSVPKFTLAEAAVEDDLGRELARATAAVAVRRRDPPPPPAPQLQRPFEEPAYPTPDPYLRPLPPGVGPVQRAQWEQQDGLTLIRSLLAGQPVLPNFELVGLRIIEVDRGRVMMGRRQRMVLPSWP